MNDTKREILKRQLYDDLKSIAHEPPPSKEDIEKNALKESASREARERATKCGTCTHSYKIHINHSLFKLRQPRRAEIMPMQLYNQNKPCAVCHCERFTRLVSEKCKCSHEKRAHIPIKIDDGEIILKCKYDSCKTKCWGFI